MKIDYLANIRLPTEKAHGIQIMKACEALVKEGVMLALVVPSRKNSITEDPFAYYGIANKFPVSTLSVPDTVRLGPLGFVFQSLYFGLKAALSLRKSEDALLYGRDEIVLAAFAFVTGKKIFWESHDGAWNIWARFLARRAEGIVVVTKAAADFYESKGISRAKLFSLPNGIELEAYEEVESKEKARARLGIPEGKTIALYIGRLDGWKGTDTFLEASKKLPDDILAVLIGGEPAQVEELKTRYPKALFLGPRPYSELASNEAAADLLVLPNTGKNATSVSFTSPLKLFSYMAGGKPIVASDLPSIREIVSEESAAFFTPDDANSLAETIGKVAGNLASYQGVADKAREEVIGYTWEARAKKLLAYLRRA